MNFTPQHKLTACTLMIAALATDAGTATVRLANDPELLTVTMVNGRPSFSKPGAYIGGKLGCNGAAYKDTQLDKVYRHCRPPLTKTQELAETLGAGFSATPYLTPSSAQQGTARQQGSASARTNSLTGAGTFLSGSSTQQITPATPVTHIPSNPPAPTTPETPEVTPVPLPASALLLLAGLGLFALKGSRHG